MPSLLAKVEKELNLPSPIESIRVGQTEVRIKRDDLIHEEVSGNKWRKLKHHLQRVEHEGCQQLVTSGGAFSNHLAAVAAVGRLAGLTTIGLVAYHKIDNDNPVLNRCRENGMQLIPIGRTAPEDYVSNDRKLDNCYYIPEGGADEYGVRGMKSIVDELEEWIPGTVVLGVGYGAMITGLDRYLPPTTRIIGVSNFEKARARRDVEQRLGSLSSRVRIDDRFQSWGFGRYEPDMIDVANRFYHQYEIILDPIYTVKVAAFLKSQASELEGPLLMIHSGGGQGWKGFQYRYGERPLPSFLQEII